MENDITQSTNNIQRLINDLAKFIAMYEHTDDRLAAKQDIVNQQIQRFSETVQDQLLKIQQALSEFSEVMTAAGAARWRVSAEQALQQGQEHTKNFEVLVNEFRGISEKCAIRLEKISIEAEKRISSLLAHLAMEQDNALSEYRKKADANHQHLETTTKSIVTSLKKSYQWLSLERMGIAFVAALIGSFLTGIYINAEWPWESNQNATYQRDVGKAVLSAWPDFSAHERSAIVHNAHIKIPTSKNT